MIDNGGRFPAMCIKLVTWALKVRKIGKNVEAEKGLLGNRVRYDFREKNRSILCKLALRY